MNTYHPNNQQEWRNWLEEHHQTADFVWLIYNRKNSPNPNLSWSEAVDEALCFGWIDSTKKSIDETTYKQYFCKRKPKSNWSKVNKDKVERLIEQGLMREAGYKSIAIAKENGSWTILDSVEALIVPDDLKEALDRYEGATAYFEGLSNSAKKSLLYWLVSAKRATTREKRILDIATNASQQQRPRPFW